uniref:Predicted protein n=1 Tax=Hordeum vulgare subsp. vulgare TaxID=112509 RepID=F2EL25_HORVV|nr:predicted protein [Hordeum vulgare subsp. vulgare]
MEMKKIAFAALIAAASATAVMASEAPATSDASEVAIAPAALVASLVAYFLY